MPPEASAAAAQRRRVRAYYQATQPLYTALWSPSAVHYGLWEVGTRTHSESILNLDRHAAEHLALPPGARVLDAGCGVGGTSRLLASRYGLRVVGATLSPRQVRGAARRARQLAPPTRPQFLLADFASTPFADATFDGIVAIESFCHAERRLEVLAEAHRLLHRGGRLVVADGFRSDDRHLATDPRYRALCHGMALPDLAGAAEFIAALGAVGFRVERDVDLTPAILPSAHRIATLSRIGVRVCRAIRLPRAWLAHGEAGLAQLPLFREGLLSYRVVVAVKTRRDGVSARALQHASNGTPQMTRQASGSRHPSEAAG